MAAVRPGSFGGQLARLGFADPERAQRLLADPALAGLVDPLEDRFADGVLAALGAVPDPDLALLTLVRLMERLYRDEVRDPHPATPARLVGLLRAGGQARDRLLAVLGTSAALGEHLVRHPEHWTGLLAAPDDDDPLVAPDPAARAREAAAAVRARLLRAVGADPHAAEPVAAVSRERAHDVLRVAYRQILLEIAGRDLTAADPTAVMPRVGHELADLAAAALDAALAIARAELPQGSPPCRIAVIGMGKCGGGELNYVSDVDVIYVVEPPRLPDGSPDVDPQVEAGALTTGARLATGLARACSAATAEGTLWPVDAALRPEGKHGPLVRTVASHLQYYQRWAQTWEFQALLKARPVAGDEALGQAYLDAITPLVWQASQRPHFVEDVQAMRRRVEQNVPAREAARQLKLGPGGLRDIEFSVQLLQLVHGRVDERLRTPTTLDGLEALSTFGYVGRDDAAEMDNAYRTLRTLEHRIQLHRLRRTHVVPDDAGDLRRLGRSFGFVADPGRELVSMWQRQAVEVRRLHEKLFYRPLLSVSAQLSDDEAKLTPEAAKARLSALGYRDPDGALRHLRSLTSGLSRRASIQRQLLPVMLGWFAAGADPDAGLLAFRRLSDTLGGTHWFLKMLRDVGGAGQRMAHVLSSSRLLSELLQRAPEAVAMLGDDDELRPRDRASMRASVRFAASRHDEPDAIASAARAVRRREIVRTGIADLAGLADLDTVGRALSDAAVAALDGALQAATLAVSRKVGGRLPTRLLIVGMGRLGGAELGYGSDADVVFVHDPLPGADEKQAFDVAMNVLSELRTLLERPGAEPALLVDANLRPEGKNGPLVRTLDSFAEYYRRWVSTWEVQALTRAVPMVGDADLAARFVELIDPLRWPEGGIDDAAVREIRRIKARVESERLPRGVQPKRHLKLGPGGLSDVEWTVQLLQLRHAYEVPGLRTSSTLGALAAATSAGLVEEADAHAMEASWRLASRIRNAVVLWTGRTGDMLPATVRELDGVARIVGHPAGSAGLLEEEYQRTARRCRVVVERVFYG
ncbi:MAG: bifunctional [glutamine synthetase] adenylyltransferase/[glutamine synthetase]-adenylyl-L-tyrosine phosphorylase [Kineosporiaceae bacterium]